MTFGEKLKAQREKKETSKDELAKVLGVTSRTVTSYENGSAYPKDRTIYYKLADFFGVNVNHFLTEHEEFFTAVGETYGKKGQTQAKQVLEQAATLFAGGELSESDQIGFLRDMHTLFLESKEMARKKYTPKKYRKQPAVTGEVQGKG